MKARLFQLDAFTSKPFAGNPAAVMLLEAFPEDGLLQSLAEENNLAETAFLVRDGVAYQIRWFTPTVEVPLCGHATLASAAVVMERLEPLRRKVVFSSASGPLAVRREGPGYVMDFPVRRCSPAEPPEGLDRALGATLEETAWDGFNFLIRLESARAVRTLSPNLAAIARLPCAGIIVTAPGDGDHDCVSRYFAPAKGIPEDPVTGGAHCALAPFWAERLGKTELRAFQASARGGGADLPSSRRPRRARGLLHLLSRGTRTMVSSHAGSCHCGGVRFTVTHDPDELTTCDCSLCVKRNALMAKVPEAALRMESGEDLLTLYEWNTKRAKHYFCRCCGIYVFHRKRAAPDHFGINIFCLDRFDVAALPVRATDGAGMTLVSEGARQEWPGPRE